MDTQAEITQMFQNLGAKGIESTIIFVDEIVELIKPKSQKFIGTFSKDISIFADLKVGGKFTEIQMDNDKRIKYIGSGKLYRYEYRKERKNLRCLFVLEENSKCVFLKAFKDDGDKKKGANSYNSNIDLALKDYKRRGEEIDERKK